MSLPKSPQTTYPAMTFCTNGWFKRNIFPGFFVSPDRPNMMMVFTLNLIDDGFSSRKRPKKVVEETKRSKDAGTGAIS
jgi:hypothetical protein